MGCASLAPLKAVALRVRAARALGATTRVVRIAEGATTAAMFPVCFGSDPGRARPVAIFSRKKGRCLKRRRASQWQRALLAVHSRRVTKFEAEIRFCLYRIQSRSDLWKNNFLLFVRRPVQRQHKTFQPVTEMACASVRRFRLKLGPFWTCPIRPTHSFISQARGPRATARPPVPSTRAAAMVVLEFGNSSTWALKAREPPASSFEEKEKRKKAGLVSLRKVLAAEGEPSGAANDGTEVGGAATSANRNFSPRSAWPEGKFTITYPKGYDPALGKFGRSGGRVVVQKLPAAERARLEAEARAVAEAAARARAEAADALNLDEEYLERVRARDEQAKSRRRRSGTAATTTTTTTTAAKPAPDPALLAEVGVDGAYMAALAEQEEKRRKVREARAVKAKAAAASAATMRLAAAFAVREFDPEMAAYARAYADRAGERAEQRELVAASRKAAAEAAAVAVKNAGKAKTRGKRRRA